MFEMDVQSVRVLKNSGKDTKEEISPSRMNLHINRVIDEISESEDITVILNGKSEIIFCIKNGKIL